MAKGWRTYDKTVPAGEQREIERGGEFFRVLACNQAEFELGLDGEALDFAKLQSYGRLAPGERFDKITIFNPNDTDLVVKIAAGFGDFGDSEVTLNGTAGGTLTAHDDVTLIAVTAGEILATNTDRREALIYNATGADLRIGGSNVTASKGINIPAGGSTVLTTTAAIFGYSVAGGNVSASEVAA